jgi:hypothetical protein
MSVSPATPATACACPRVALRADAAVARLRLAAGLEALILALLARLFLPRLSRWAETAGDHSPDDLHHAAPYAYALIMPAMGRAPHAACIEAGLVPDWILPGVRNRGMRPAATPTRQRRRARPARAPPSHPRSHAQITPPPGDADSRP